MSPAAEGCVNAILGSPKAPKCLSGPGDGGPSGAQAGKKTKRQGRQESNPCFWEDISMTQPALQSTKDRNSPTKMTSSGPKYQRCGSLPRGEPAADRAAHTPLGGLDYMRDPDIIFFPEPWKELEPPQPPPKRQRRPVKMGLGIVLTAENSEGRGGPEAQRDSR